MMNLRVLVCFMACAFVLSACGQKGDLYLPNAQQTISSNDNNSDSNNQVGNEDDRFLLPDIKQRIENIKNNPNDF